MNKLKVLFGLTIFFVGSGILNMVVLSYFYPNENAGPKFPYSDPRFWTTQAMVYTILIGVAFISTGLWKTINVGPFEKVSRLGLKIGGYVLLIMSVVSFINDIIPGNPEDVSTLLVIDTLLFVIGLRTLFISDVIRTGISIKLDNDLTI